MNTTRFLEIGNDLGLLYIESRNAEISLANHREDLAGRKLALAPADGWPGKNEGERKLASEAAYAADETCLALVRTIREDEMQASVVQAQIQALEAERRGLEWEIRARLVEAMSHSRVQANSNGPADETVFDDVIQAQADVEIDADASELTAGIQPAK